MYQQIIISYPCQQKNSPGVSNPNFKKFIIAHYTALVWAQFFCAN